MKPAICARCSHRKDCPFRQPGTWVSECDRYEDDLSPHEGDPSVSESSGDRAIAENAPSSLSSTRMKE